jgi:hypothetical protein
MMADIENRVFALRALAPDLRDPRRADIVADLARLSLVIRAVRGNGEPL